MLPKPKRNCQTLTGTIQPITFKQVVKRTQSIRYRAKTPSHNRTLASQHTQSRQINRSEWGFPLICQPQTDKMVTNFHSIQQQRPIMATVDPKRPRRSSIYSQQRKLRYSEHATEQKPSLRNMRDKQKVSEYLKRQQRVKKMENEQQRLLIYKQQINEFRQLYQSLGNILSNIKQNLSDVENAISQYLAFIQTKKLSFIDDFLEGQERKVKKVIRQSRLQESLSVAYLFLEMAQHRLDDHESYLTNFLGYCLSNVLLATRIYMLKEKKQKQIIEQFQTAVRQIEVGSFGHPLSSLQEVAFRMQHNNEILVMIHKKLGRFNTNFESCIQFFFKEAERKKTSCVQCTHYIFDYLALYIHKSDLLGISRSLQTAPRPFCAEPTKKYTLVLQPMGIIFFEGKYRPYLFQFLEWAHKYFQIILWTWQMPYQPELLAIAQRLEGYLTSKLYRYHCQNINDVWVKDLEHIGRQIEHMLIIDYDRRIYCKQPQNGIEMRWISRGLKKDKGLLFLCQILQQMISTDSMVSDTLRIYSQQLYSISGL